MIAIIETKIKICAGCKKEKPHVEFYKHSSEKDGLQRRCKTCVKAYQQDHKKDIAKYQRGYQRGYRQPRKGETAGYQKNYYETIDGYLRHIFNGMRQRCDNPKAYSYKWYGRRGIKVCFKNANEFIDYVVNELQVDPRGLTIDRIDNDGHYEPGNIRFVSQAENNQNREA